MSEMQKSPTGTPLIREWAEQQYEEARSKRVRLEPIVKQNKQRKYILMGLGWVMFFVSIPFHHPQDFVIMGVGYIFILWGIVLSFRAIKPESEYEVAKWQMEVMSMGLRIGEGIAMQKEVEAKQK